MSSGGQAEVLGEAVVAAREQLDRDQAAAAGDQLELLNPPTRFHGKDAKAQAAKIDRAHAGRGGRPAGSQNKSTMALREYLLAALPLEQILVHPMIRRMVVLPGSGPVPSSSELLVSPVMLALVQELKRRYPTRHVIFDLPPVLTTDDVLAFAPYLDAMLLVAQEGKTERDELARAAELVQGANHNLMGTVLNRSSEQNSL